MYSVASPWSSPFSSRRWRPISVRLSGESLPASEIRIPSRLRRERPSVDYAENLINAVAKNKSAVLHRNSRLGSRDKSAVHVNDVFGCHGS